MIFQGTLGQSLMIDQLRMPVVSFFQPSKISVLKSGKKWDDIPSTLKRYHLVQSDIVLE